MQVDSPSPPTPRASPPLRDTFIKKRYFTSPFPEKRPGFPLPFPEKKTFPSPFPMPLSATEKSFIHSPFLKKKPVTPFEMKPLSPSPLATKPVVPPEKEKKQPLPLPCQTNALSPEFEVLSPEISSHSISKNRWHFTCTHHDQNNRGTVCIDQSYHRWRLLVNIFSFLSEFL